MTQNLTTSQIERQNVLNNRIAIPRIQETIGIQSLEFNGKYYLTKQMVADFFEVNVRTIDNYLSDYEEELKHNGYILCKGKMLTEFKLHFAHEIDFASKTTQLGLFDFRSFLNIGMLLSESEKAKKLRSAILDIVIATINEKAGGGTKYINWRDREYLPAAIQEENYRKNFTSAVNECVEGHKTFKYSQITDMIYKAATNWSAHADFIFATESYTGDTAPAGTVDMGTSVFWATCNLGAANPEDYGDYYAWGETEPYYESQSPFVWKEGKSAGYAWPSYKWCTGTEITLTKYNTDSYYGPVVDNKTMLEKADDAAYAALGGNYCIPTTDEWGQLRWVSIWTWTSRGGHNGYEVTSRTTGNTIFLPASGYRYDTNLYDAGSRGDYWSSSLNPGCPRNAYYCEFHSNDAYPEYDYLRCLGYVVRPVSY